tara:strand:+ start:22 stop:672 length:651 start_codon:yes stop_codon:yes gene_type:complete
MNIPKSIHPKMANHYNRLNHYKLKYHYSPKKILDIGALDGRWSQCAKIVFTDCEILMIEANQDMEHVLKQTGFGYYITALSDSVKKTNYYKLPGHAGNSLYYEKNSVDPEINTIETTTLENLIDKNEIFNFIKLDVQGSEIDILRGGKDFMTKADFILTECSLVEYNLDAPSFEDQLDFFNENNFSMIDIFDLLYDKNGKLLQLDVLFKNNKFNLL